MMNLDDLPTPALIVDLDKLEGNISSMAGRARQLGVSLRPHVKTQKCIEIGKLQVDAGAGGITAATLYEAEVFADAGFDDITWAFPLILSRIPQALVLAQRVELGVVVDSMHAAQALAATKHPFKTWIKVDCGYGRSGIDPAADMAERLVGLIEAERLRFAGLLSHSGDAYDHDTVEGRAAAAEQERRVQVEVADRLRAAGYEVPALSVGSTPSMTAVRDLDGVTEARAGNYYAYFDLMQVRLGSCTVAECALTVVSSVVSSSRDHAVVDAGALALSQDPGLPPASMGAIYEDYEAGTLDDDLQVVSLSQEHGKLSQPRPVGRRLRILPNHAGLTAACFPECYVVRGQRVVDRWRVWNGR